MSTDENSAQEPVSIVHKRRWQGFRLWTLLLAVAACAVLFGAIVGVRRTIRRYQVDQAIEAARIAGPEAGWPYSSTRTSRAEELVYLLSDRERVLEELLQTVERDPIDGRQIHAIRTMRVLLRQPTPAALRKRCLSRLLDLMERGPRGPAVELEMGAAVVDWAAFSGLDTRQRAIILAKATNAREGLLPGWAAVLATIRGRKETLFLIGLGDSHDPTLLNAVHNSSLVGSFWPGLLPALKRWLDDPVIAPHVFRYSLLGQSPEGRALLLAYATSDRCPIELRRRAIERLEETFPGTNLLVNAVDDPAALEVIGASIEGDPRTTFRTTLAQLRRQGGEGVLKELIDGLDGTNSNPILSSPSELIEAPGSGADAGVLQRIRESKLRCLRWLTGETALQSEAEWQHWFETSRPRSIDQCALVKLVLDHPEALDNLAILRRIVPYHLGGLPPESIPLYERMAREGPPASRFWACMALLLCTPKTDAAPILIDLIDPRGIDDAGFLHSGAIDVLKQRFNENFFSDTAAWRNWWAEENRPR